MMTTAFSSRKLLLSPHSSSLRRPASTLPSPLSGGKSWNNENNRQHPDEFGKVTTFGNVGNQLEYRNRGYTVQGNGNVRLKCPGYEDRGNVQKKEKMYEQRGGGSRGSDLDYGYREMWNRGVQREMMQLGYDRVQGHEQVVGNHAQWSAETRNVQQGMMQPGFNRVQGHGQVAGNHAQWSPETQSVHAGMMQPGSNRAQGHWQVAGKQGDWSPKTRSVRQGMRQPGYNGVQGRRHVAGNQAHWSPETRNMQQGMRQSGYNRGQGHRHVSGNQAKWSSETRNVQQGMVQPRYNRVQGRGHVPGNQAKWSPETRSVQKGMMRPEHNQVQGHGKGANDQAPSTMSSAVDLLGLCQLGKVKEAIELMDKGERADAQCFRLLFEVCEKSEKYEDAKKVYEFFLSSTCRSDDQLINEVLKMYSDCESMTDARRVLDQMLQQPFTKPRPRRENRTCSGPKPPPSFWGRTDFLNLLIRSNTT